MLLQLQGKQIELVYSAKYLDIYLDYILSWSEFIKEFCINVSKLSGVFHHIASFINVDMIRQLCYAYVFPHIDYAIELYGSACKINIAKIQCGKSITENISKA